MGGGTTVAPDVLDPAAFASAVEACEYYGLRELADLMKRIVIMDDDDELVTNAECYRLVRLWASDERASPGTA